MSERSTARFTDTICPDCRTTVMPVPARSRAVTTRLQQGLLAAQTSPAEAGRRNGGGVGRRFRLPDGGAREHAAPVDAGRHPRRGRARPAPVSTSSPTATSPSCCAWSRPPPTPAASPRTTCSPERSMERSRPSAARADRPLTAPCPAGRERAFAQVAMPADAFGLVLIEPHARCSASHATALVDAAVVVPEGASRAPEIAAGVRTSPTASPRPDRRRDRDGRVAPCLRTARPAGFAIRACGSTPSAHGRRATSRAVGRAGPAPRGG